MPNASRDLVEKAVNTLRMLAADAVQQANSGHPGMPMGAADMAFVLWTRHLRFDPDGAALARARPVPALGRPRLDAALRAPPPRRLRLHARRPEAVPPARLAHRRPPGVRPPARRRGDERPARPGLRERRRHGARPGHARGEARPGQPGRRPLRLRDRLGRRPHGGRRAPRRRASPATTGSAGSSTSTTTTRSPSTARPRSPSPARTSRSGSRATAGTCRRWTAAITRRIHRAIEAAKAETRRPSLVRVRTTIGFGSPGKAGKSSVHGAPLGEDELKATKRNLGWPEEPRFLVPDDVRALWRDVRAEKAAQVKVARERERVWRAGHPDQAALLDVHVGALGAGADVRAAPRGR